MIPKVPPQGRKGAQNGSKSNPQTPGGGPRRPPFFRSVPELRPSSPEVTKKSPKATKTSQKGAKKTPPKAPEYVYNLSLKKLNSKIGGRSALFFMVFGAPNLGRVQEPRGLKLIEKVKLKKWRAFRPVFHVFVGTQNLGRVREPGGLHIFRIYKKYSLSVCRSVCLCVCLSVSLFFCLCFCSP